MTDQLRNAQLDATIALTTDEMTATVYDSRRQSLDLFGTLDEAQRTQLATDAWTIGLRAIANAYTAAQESRLKEVGTGILADVDRQLRGFVEQQQAAIEGVLGRFFDPADGQVVQRLAAFVDDHGVLARLLEKFLAPQNSVLAEALTRQIGEGSPLLRKLSSTDSEGLIKTLEAQLDRVMAESHAELVRALDPLAEGGAVARFLGSLRDELKGTEENRQQQLAVALRALDANDADSLLSRLVRETNLARQEVLAAVNPELPGSPLAVLQTTLTRLLEEQTAGQVDFSRRQEERQSQFEKDVREAIARIETRRTEALKTTRGGLDFEGTVADFIARAIQGAPCTFEVTGATAGLGRCKKGDAVLRFTPDSAFAGTGIVFEAKRDSTYTTQKALDELDAARKNRDAVAGVFVMAQSHAADVFPRFARHGNNVLVVWDDQDPQTNPYLHAALLLGMGLATRSQRTGDQGDIMALRDLESRIETELSRLDRMEKSSDSIRRNVDNIADEIRKARKALDLLVRNAQSTLRALNVAIDDEHEVAGSPIMLPAGSLENAKRALPDANEAA